jgi:hypothetical protein
VDIDMRATITKTSKRAKWIINTTMALVVPNFVIFWIITVCQGGDALNGYVRKGHYFVCAHGACTEVSKATWTFSYWHAISAYLGIVLIFAEAAILVNTKDIDLDFNENAQQSR